MAFIGTNALAAGGGALVTGLVMHQIFGKDDPAPVVVVHKEAAEPDVREQRATKRAPAAEQAEGGYNRLDFMAMVGELNRSAGFAPFATEVAAHLGVSQNASGGLAAGALFRKLDVDTNDHVSTTEMLPFVDVIDKASSRSSVAEAEAKDPSFTPGANTELTLLSTTAERDLEPLSPKER